MIGVVITINLLQPASAHDSPIGIKECSVGYWSLIAVLLLTCVAVTVLAIKINQGEQAIKIKYGVNYLETDPLYEGANLRTLVLIGFLGGLIAGALGLGGGSIYNPAFLEMGIHTKSASASGMFLVLISTINSITINYVNGYLDVYYGLWISLYALIGSTLGLAATDWVVARTNKPSIMVWLLVFVFVISTVSTPIFGGIQVAADAQAGNNIWEFNSLCSS